MVNQNTNQTYYKLRDTNKHLEMENERLQKEMESFKTGVVRVSGIPNFLFTDNATNEEIYTYLKSNPKSSKFLFKKYSNKNFIKEICDPENPLYNEEVSEVLKDKFNFETEKNDIENLIRQRIELNREIQRLKDKETELQNEIYILPSEIQTKKDELNSISMEIANIKAQSNYKELNKVLDTIQSIRTLIEQRIKDGINSLSGETWDESPFKMDFSIPKKHIKILIESEKILSESIKSDKLLSDTNINSIMEQRAKAYNDALASLEFARSENITDVIGKIRKIFNAYYSVFQEKWKDGEIIDRIQMAKIFDQMNKEDALILKVERLMGNKEINGGNKK